jgi:DNA (cytosine-5)-methyltransferase 1
MPGISDAERLQGLRRGWTSPAAEVDGSDRVRWKLVGNAVSVPVARWIGKRIVAFDNSLLAEIEVPDARYSRRHNVAWGGPGERRKEGHLATEGPKKPKRISISDFKFFDHKPLSIRAAKGFLARLLESPLIVESDFKSDLAKYCRQKASVGIAA